MCSAIMKGQRLMPTKQAQLEDLVYDCVASYVTMRRATRQGLETMNEIERHKRALPLSLEEREELIHELTQRAWTRVATEQPEMFEGAGFDDGAAARLH